MATNPYGRTPLYAAQVDPVTGHHVRAFFFLGAVPRATLDAARRGRASNRDPRRVEWSAADGATLRAYYGASWRSLLTAEDPPAPEAHTAEKSAQFAAQAFGGSEALDFGDLAGLEDLGDASGQAPLAPESAPRADWSVVAPGPPVYTDLAVYPEDTVLELRLKLGLASGVPLYRQHFFYYLNAGEEGPILPYRFAVDGAPVVVDWRDLQEFGAARRGARPNAEASTEIAGVPVDPRLEERREGLKVEALDTFTALGPAPGLRLARAYFVDLYALLPPLGASERPLDGLAAVLRDRYQFDLLYYGGLLKYWPQLSADACSLALSDPGRVGAVYAALDPDPTALRQRFAAERTIADSVQSWRPAAAKGARASIAVTAATVRVAPEAARMRVSVRNVFDWLPTGPSVAAIVARFDVDAALLTEAGATLAPSPKARQGGAVPVLAVKRHVTSRAPRAAATIDRFLARPLRRDTVSFALARDGDGDGARAIPGLAGRQTSYAYLAVQADGQYEAATDWREDDRAGFERVAADLAAVVGPTLGAINAMGAAAFPIGGTLGAPARGARLGAITASAFWPHTLSAAAFRELKGRFRAYERAGVVGIRGLQQAGAYAFTFRKGVIAYDPRLVERASARGPDAAGDRAGHGLAPTNQYAWLTDPTVASRWAAAFPGRLVRIFHRATDLRVEVLLADSLAEFELIRRYIFAFLDGLLSGASRLRVGAPREALATREADGTASRRLRRLQERDPDLFDLKKHDQGATSYSILCQSGRQPHVFNEEEARGLGAKRRGALVQYWNFTDNAPAFYECPDPKFPHLSFRAGQHPLGFCLPCCKKTRPAPGSRAALANEGCLARRGGPGEPNPEAALSRHVLTYGKAVPVGRISGLPRELGEGLLLDALPPPFSLHLVGVEQTTPAVPDAGFAYALAWAAGVGDGAPEEVLSELAQLAAQMGDTFYALGGGGAAAFATAADLADAVLGAFVRRDAALSPFGPGGAAAECWRPILAELARHAFGVETVIASDPKGTGAITLEAAPDAVAALLGRGAGPCFVPPRVALLVVGPMGTYPVAALNPKLYLRAALAHRWMAARRNFGIGDRAALEEASEAGSGVEDRVVEVLLAALAFAAPEPAGAPDLAAVARYAAGAPSREAGPRRDSTLPPRAFTIEARLVDMRNRCYAVLLRPAGGPGPQSEHDARVYFPVRWSAYPVDGTPTIFGARPAGPLPRRLLREAVDSFNAWLSSVDGLQAACPPIRPAARLLTPSGDVVGFVSEPGPDGGLYYYHDPDPAAEGPAERPASSIRLPYDPREIDEAILGEARQRPPGAASSGIQAARPEDALASAAAHRNKLYRLFLAEFAAVLRRDRNPAIRRELAAAVAATSFESPDSMALLRRRLAEILRTYPSDLQVAREAVKRAYVQAPRDPAAAILAALEATVFEFDRQTLARLQGLGSRLEVVAALRALLADRVVVVPAGQASALPGNIYTACSEQGVGLGAGACVARPGAPPRLAVPADRIDAFYEILAADACNAGKAGLLSAAAAGVFDVLSFIRRPGEHLELTLGEH